MGEIYSRIGWSRKSTEPNRRIYYSTIAPFTILGQKNAPKYSTLLHCRTGQKYGLKRSGKIAGAQNEPNFALFTSSDLDFLTDERFTKKTQSDLNVFYKWAKSVNETRSLENIPEQELDKVLVHFFF